MAFVTVERLDHLGIIAGVIKDIGIIKMIDTRLVPDNQEDITPGKRWRHDPQWSGLFRSALVLDAAIFRQQTPGLVVS